MEILLELLKDNLGTVISYVIFVIIAIVYKKSLSPALVEKIKGVTTIAQSLIIEILAEIARKPNVVNNKLMTPVVVPDKIHTNAIKKSIAIQALKELAYNKELLPDSVNKSKYSKVINKVDSIAKGVGGYDKLVELVYKSGRLILKALKK